MLESPVLWGTAICCVVPLLSFVAGFVIAKRGAPIAVQYRWRSRQYDESEA
jgi:hypothetical protein